MHLWMEEFSIASISRSTVSRIELIKELIKCSNPLTFQERVLFFETHAGMEQGNACRLRYRLVKIHVYS